MFNKHKLRSSERDIFRSRQNLRMTCSLVSDVSSCHQNTQFLNIHRYIYHFFMRASHVIFNVIFKILIVFMQFHIECVYVNEKKTIHMNSSTFLFLFKIVYFESFFIKCPILIVSTHEKFRLTIF